MSLFVLLVMVRTFELLNLYHSLLNGIPTSSEELESDMKLELP